VLQTMLIIAISIKWYIRYLYIQQICMILVLQKHGRQQGYKKIHK
jgi:hypothetical protein